MNPIFHEAANLADGGGMMGAITAFFLAFFVVAAINLVRPGARAASVAAARLPFDRDELEEFDRQRINEEA